MAFTRVTQSMMSKGSVAAMQTSLSRLAKLQEQLSTGRVLNRPSDSPTDPASALRMRAATAPQQQFQRNAQDGLAWLGQPRVDGTRFSHSTFGNFTALRLHSCRALSSAHCAVNLRASGVPANDPTEREKEPLPSRQYVLPLS